MFDEPAGFLPGAVSPEGVPALPGAPRAIAPVDPVDGDGPIDPLAYDPYDLHDLHDDPHGSGAPAPRPPLPETVTLPTGVAPVPGLTPREAERLLERITRPPRPQPLVADVRGLPRLTPTRGGRARAPALLVAAGLLGLAVGAALTHQDRGSVELQEPEQVRARLALELAEGRRATLLATFRRSEEKALSSIAAEGSRAKAARAP